jgi:3-oxoadipate enol-lactonase
MIDWEKPAIGSSSIMEFSYEPDVTRRKRMSNDVPTQHGFAEVNGAHLYYEIAGSGHTVVLVHAGIADHRMWDDQFAPFPERYRVIRYDQRGFGQSTAPAGSFAFHDDLYYLLRQLDVTQATIVGVSQGGTTAINLALAHPEMVDGLVVVGSGLGGLEWPPPTPEELALFAQVEEAAEAGDFATANDLEVHIWVDGPRRNSDTVDSDVRERVRDMNLQTFTRHDENEQAQSQELEPPARARLGEIETPTLILIGDQDVSSIQAIADYLAADIPGARKVVLPNTAHVPNMEYPEVFNQIVLDFLDSLGR